MDYDSLAHTYARYRKVSSVVVDEIQRVWQAFPESKVLEVGCGTGTHLTALVEAIGCCGWGVDPSREMISHASAHERIHFLQGFAEELPFENYFFDLVFSINVVHHMQSTLTYFQEALRVLKRNGIICTATDSERIIRNRKPLAQYWPGTVDVDINRYPSIALLKQQMATVGFTDIKEHEIQRLSKVEDATPYREKAFSCLHLISEDEFIEGLQRLEKDLKAGPVQVLSEYVCLWGRCP